ncbi:MAG: signal transduction histidine kinase [Cryomorphaceae bacterium]
MIKLNIQEKINEQLMDKLQLAYVCVDHLMVVKDVSPNLGDYGFGEIATGEDVTDYMDFMVGMDSSVELDLPMVSSPSGIPISVSLMPDSGQLTVLISNASVQAEQRQKLQQTANENELLVLQQKCLMKELGDASQQLELKNKQLEEASRLQTSFLSGVSHEFRTPLTSIIGYTNLLRQDVGQIDEDPPHGEGQVEDKDSYLRAVQRSSKHLLSLVENLLDHGKLDANEIVIRQKPADLGEIFKDVEILLKPLCTTKNISLKVEAKLPDGLKVIVDDSRLRQCLINLIGNAVKFTDEGSVEVNALLNDQQIEVQIVDTGPGISSEDLEKIRLPFWQGSSTNKVGTGLGLTITEKIVKLMGGQLDIYSELSVGTIVNFTLPAPELPAPELPAHAELERPQFASGKHILLAEDDSDIADLVGMMLGERGVMVTHVENGALALDALSKSEFDLVLMDIHMPVMTGYEVMQELQIRGDTTPIVVMSASALDNDRSRAESLGSSGYVVKPVDTDDLLAIAAAVIGK